MISCYKTKNRIARERQNKRQENRERVRLETEKE
jgi:hypothetical protein